MMAIYFLINLFFVLRRSSIIDTIGKFLTPALIIILIIIIVKGVINPIGDIASTGATNVISYSLLEGYQTMDALAGFIIFQVLLHLLLFSKGYKGKEINSVLLNSSFYCYYWISFLYMVD